MRLLTVLIPILLLAVPASARDIYVNNVEGDDRYQGEAPSASGTSDGPCRTLARALRAAENGDRIIVANTGVPYRESITLQASRHSGLANRPFVILGNGAILDGSQPVPPEAWKHHRGDVFRFRPRRKRHQLLYLDGKPAKRRHATGSQGSLPKLQPLEWCLWKGDVYFRTEENRLPQSYKLSHTVLPVGLTLYEVRHVRITDLVLQGFQLDGVNAHDGVFEGLLVGLTCRGNGRSGISVGGACRVRIESCLVGNNGVAQVRTEGFSHTEIVDSELIDHQHAPALDHQGGEVEVRRAEDQQPAGDEVDGEDEP